LSIAASELIANALVIYFFAPVNAKEPSTITLEGLQRYLDAAARLERKAAKP
jgi:hypothetical protein